MLALHATNSFSDVSPHSFSGAWCGSGVSPAHGFGTGLQHEMQGGMGGNQRNAEQMTGKRGCDDDSMFAKRARTDLGGAPFGADVCLEDVPGRSSTGTTVLMCVDDRGLKRARSRAARLFALHTLRDACFVDAHVFSSAHSSM